jgi:site-specific recombinase XerD
MNKSKSNHEGAPIMLRITINGVQVTMNVKRRINPKDWDSKCYMPKVTNAFTDDLYVYLETLRSKAFNAFTELTKDYDEVTPAMVRDYLQGVKGGSTKTINEIWKEHNDNLYQLIGKGNSRALWQKHNVAHNHLKAFLKLKHRVGDMPIKQIKFPLIKQFKSYLMGEKNLGYNTTMKILQNMKKITMLAIKCGWLRLDPFADISLAMKLGDRPYLTDEELKRIQEKTFTIKRLDLVKDLFLFSCYTGMAYVDVKKLKKSEIEQTADGLWWIKTRRQKTKHKSQIPLLSYAKEIIDKYTNLKSLKANDQVLPVLSNQKLNSYLKEIADTCGIEKNLTFHVARHTFATTVTLQNGVPIESVSRMMGHTNIKTTQHYARIVDKKIANDMIALSVRTNIPLAT